MLPEECYLGTGLNRTRLESRGGNAVCEIGILEIGISVELVQLSHNKGQGKMFSDLWEWTEVLQHSPKSNIYGVSDYSLDYWFIMFVCMSTTVFVHVYKCLCRCLSTCTCVCVSCEYVCLCVWVCACICMPWTKDDFTRELWLPLTAVVINW